jgi:AraC family transcriptional regulator
MIDVLQPPSSGAASLPRQAPSLAANGGLQGINHRSMRDTAALQGSPYEAATVARLHSAIEELSNAIDRVFSEDRAKFAASLQRATALLQIEPMRTTDTPPAAAFKATLPRGGLAPWQKQKVGHYIDTNLDTNFGVGDLSALTKLSRYHFSRAFRQSFGMSPHAFVMRKRIERAQELMLSGQASLAQIAADCGLADQSHLTRRFRQLVGESPGAWRRARMSCPA